MLRKTVLSMYIWSLTSCLPAARKIPFTLDDNSPKQSQNDYDLAKGCETHFLGSSWRCPETKFEVFSRPLSESSVPFIKNLPIQTRIAYSFHCQYTGPSPQGRISSLDSKLNILIAPTDQPTVESITSQIPKNIPIKISIFFEPVTFINGPCQFKVINVLSAGSLDMINLYGDQVIELKNWTEESLVAFDQASTLNEKWQVFVDLPNQLVRNTQSDIRHCRRRVVDLSQAIERREEPEAARQIVKLLGSTSGDPDFKRLCPASLDAQNPSNDPCLESIELLSEDGEIGQVQRKIKESACLARDLREGLPETLKCLTPEEDSPFCLKKIQKKKQVLVDKKALVLEPRIVGLSDFLKAEIIRLTSLSDSLTLDFKDLLNRLYPGER